MDLLRDVRKALRAIADPARAPAMQAYMKSAMPYHGVPMPLLRKVCRTTFAGLRFADAPQWTAEVLGLWRGARFREERYAAIELSGDRRATPYQVPAAMPMYEEIVVDGAWWDYVDVVASRRIGPILMANPATMRRLMRAWSRSDDLWKRRSSILSQLGFKGATDLELLYACIEPSLGSREFFLQKAIGWALREFAWTDPAEVRRYVEAQHERLAPLSRREALKNCG
ncbi:MAG TPA: DNA alkylation repair protein [Burkholderiaceae bacterium]|nr:DNA alkylation repair protein [Burkholderiaceae bacterium]